MHDKIVLITGGTGGIGKQTALALAKMGAQVIITGRNKSSGEEAVTDIRRASGNTNIDLLPGDLSKQADVRSLTEQFRTKYERLDVLINNAGLAASQWQLTIDGMESDFAVNVIAPFMLTYLLMDSLKASSSARVINLTGGDVPLRLELDRLQSKAAFDGLNTYSQSKLAMMALTYEFARRTPGVAINVCYPGQASTKMTRSVTADMLPGPMRFMFPLFKWMVRDDGGKSAAKASRSSVHLASAREVEGISGKYFDPNGNVADWPPAVMDAEVRQRLWKLAEESIH